MPTLSEVRKLAPHVDGYVEELHEFFTFSKVPYGSSADLAPFVERLNTPGSFADEMTSMIRSIIFREHGTAPRTELVELIAVAVGGPEIDQSAQQVVEPIRRILEFVNGVMRARQGMPGDEPATPTSQPEARPSDEAQGRAPARAPRSSIASHLSIAAQPAPESPARRDPPLPTRDTQSPPVNGRHVTVASLAPDAAASQAIPSSEASEDRSLAAVTRNPDHSTKAHTTLRSDRPSSILGIDQASPEISTQPSPAVFSRAERVRAVSVRQPESILGLSEPIALSAESDSPVVADIQSTPAAAAPLMKPLIGILTLCAVLLAVIAGVLLRRRPASYMQAAPILSSYTGSYANNTVQKPAASGVPAQPNAGPVRPIPASTFSGQSAPPVADARPIRGDRATGIHGTSPGVIAVPSGMMAANLIDSPEPDYPRLARMAHVEGPVVVRALVARSGEVISTRALSGPRLLRTAAAHDVLRWRYRPYAVNGRPTEVTTVVTVDFRLHD